MRIGSKVVFLQTKTSRPSVETIMVQGALSTSFITIAECAVVHQKTQEIVRMSKVEILFNITSWLSCNQNLLR